jgi:type I restriction enzyme S subunit
MFRLFSELVQVNPKIDLPLGANASTQVSFIPMSDVTETGDWIGRQERVLGTVRNGFTAFADGDVLVAKITPCFENGKGAHVTGLKNGIGFGSTEFHVLRARDGVSSRFVHHVTQSEHLRRAAEAFMSGSAGQRRVPGDFFEHYFVPDISFREQNVLAQVLDTLDAAIRKTEAIIEKLKQVKQGLLHDLLTRGIDANGELRPPQNQAPHLYKESPLGWIPCEWTAAPLSEAADLQVGFAFKSEWFRDSGRIKLLRGDNVGYGVPEWSGEKFLDESHVALFGAYALEVGDIVVGMDRTFTKSGAKFSIIGIADLPCLLVQRVGRFIPVGCSISFLRILTQWSEFHIRLMAQQKGMDIPHLSKGEILAPPVPIPSPDEQAKIVEHMGSIEQRLNAEIRTLEKLRAKKNGLMDDLLTGRVPVTPLL